MNKDDVMALLADNQNERGIKNWEKMTDNGGLSSFGIGLTVLRKLAKKIGRNHELALELWQSDNYDAKTIGLLIDEPKKITKEQAESQVESLGMGMLVHVFSSCDATLPKAPFAVELAREWVDSDCTLRKRCAFGLYYELSKNKRNKALTDEYFLYAVEKVRNDYDVSLSGNLKISMGSSLMGIGKRNVELHSVCLPLAQEIGDIDFNEDGGKCDPMNIAKHLKTPYLLEKLGLA